jgi:hypothetical protein
MEDWQTTQSERWKRNEAHFVCDSIVKNSAIGDSLVQSRRFLATEVRISLEMSRESERFDIYSNSIDNLVSIFTAITR